MMYVGVGIGFEDGQGSLSDTNSSKENDTPGLWSLSAAGVDVGVVTVAEASGAAARALRSVINAFHIKKTELLSSNGL